MILHQSKHIVIFIHGLSFGFRFPDAFRIAVEQAIDRS